MKSIKTHLTVRITPSLKRTLKEYRAFSMSIIVEAALQDFLAKREESQMTIIQRYRPRHERAKT